MEKEINETPPLDDNTTAKLSKALASWYVRKDGKFYDIRRLDKKSSREDIERAAMHRFQEDYPEVTDLGSYLKPVFHTAITQRSGSRDQSIPVWSGTSLCDPKVDSPFIWDSGMVAINTWVCPDYRKVQFNDRDIRLFDDFIDFVFVRAPEKDKFLDWLAWNLKNEGDKPTWAPFLYSEAKGSGKSTLCELTSMLFGKKNTVIQNSVDKLTARFNMTVLTSKLVISEELNLKAGSAQGNMLKTYITETEALAERKGVDAETVQQCCCFLFTTNHLPLWIEADERRYYLIDVDHDGHASGPRAKEFSELVGALKLAMTDDAFVASVHKSLIERQLSDGFNAKTLNAIEDATPLMKRVESASEATVVSLLREHLAETGKHAILQKDIARIVNGELKASISSTKHLMPKLGWNKVDVKWGGQDYKSAIWYEKGYWIESGKLYGPDGFETTLAEHFKSEFDIDITPKFDEEAVKTGAIY